MGKARDGYSKQGDASPDDQGIESGDAEKRTVGNLPVHPVACMQGAFEESIIQTINSPKTKPAKERHERVDAATRRRVLLQHEQSRRRSVYGRSHGKPPQRYHPLWKLVAQIAFGIHLLHQQLAKSDAEVTKILQTHVDDVDEFLEDTTEDFDLAQSDIEERIKNLRIPLEHIAVFDQMLDDREFRTQIVDGNEKIEYIINRTAAAMNRALEDIQEGIKATDELARYLLRVKDGWENRSDGLIRVYAAMTSNVEGWYRCLVGLQMKGNSLGVALVKLGSIVSELQKRAGMASRKHRNSVRIVEIPSVIEDKGAKQVKEVKIQKVPARAVSKPLPDAPDPVQPAVQATLPRHTPPFGRSFPPEANFRHPSHVRNESAVTHKSSKGSLRKAFNFGRDRSPRTSSRTGSPLSSTYSPGASENSYSDTRKLAKGSTRRLRPVPEQYPKPLAEKEPPNKQPDGKKSRSKLAFFSTTSLRLKRAPSRAAIHQVEQRDDVSETSAATEVSEKPVKRKSLLRLKSNAGGVKELDGHVERAF